MANHDKGCICCRRIANDVSKYTSTVTKQSYTIDGNYTCKTNNCIYLVTCGICEEQYVGKTTMSMKKRHEDHRSDIKTNRYGLGTHFFKHAEKMGINMDTNMEDIMQYFNLSIITSSDKYPAEEWKDMEGSLMQTLKTTQDHGGINIRMERIDDQKLYKCNQCDFRANLKSNIAHHKRRDHSDYKVLCDQCEYMSNDLGHFKHHFIAKHPEDFTVKHLQEL